MSKFETNSSKINDKRAKIKESLAYTSKILNLFSNIDTEDYSEE